MRYNKSKETERIWKEYCVDKTIDEIAEHFDVEKGWARQRCHNFGIKVKHINSDKYKGLEDYARHHTVSEAAEKYNCPKNRIYQYAHTHNIEFVREPKKNGVERAVYKRTGEAQDMIVTLCSYYSYASIGRVFGYSKERIRQLWEGFWEESKKVVTNDRTVTKKKSWVEENYPLEYCSVWKSDICLNEYKRDAIEEVCKKILEEVEKAGFVYFGTPTVNKLKEIIKDLGVGL